MSSEKSKQLAARRKELRRELEHRRKEARAELERRREALQKKPRKRDRRWLWVLAAIVAIVLLLLSDCSCGEGVVEVVEVVVEEPVETEPVPEEVPVVRSPPSKLRMQRLDRPEYKSEVPEVLPWVASFRLQVQARSPRLAACFVGAQRPGRLKWTAAVEPGDGRVSDQTLEPTIEDQALTKEQRSCVIGVLSEPPYNLEIGDERSTPSRVGMVIEF
jgi:hypothetical protein